MSHLFWWLLGIGVADYLLDKQEREAEERWAAASQPGWKKVTFSADCLKQYGRDYYWDGQRGWYPGQDNCPPWPFPWPIAYYGQPFYHDGILHEWDYVKNGFCC